MSVQTQSQTQQTQSQTQNQTQAEAQGSSSSAQRSACVEVRLRGMLIDIERICSEFNCEYAVRIQHRRDRHVSMIDRYHLPPGIDAERIQYVVDNIVEFTRKGNSFEVVSTAVAKLLSEINIHINPRWIVAVWIDACV